MKKLAGVKLENQVVIYQFAEVFEQPQHLVHRNRHQHEQQRIFDSIWSTRTKSLRWLEKVPVDTGICWADSVAQHSALS